MPTSFAGHLFTAFLTNATLTLTRNCLGGRRCRPPGTPRCADGAPRGDPHKQCGAQPCFLLCSLSTMLPTYGLGVGCKLLRSCAVQRSGFPAALSVCPWYPTRTAHKGPPSLRATFYSILHDHNTHADQKLSRRPAVTPTRDPLLR